jgi:hypothetical protein
MDRVEGVGQIDREDRLPLRRGKLLDRGHELNAGIVDHDVDGVMCRLGRAHHRDDLVAPAHVGIRIAHLDAGPLFQCRPDALDLAGITEAVECDVGARLGERCRHPETDPARRAGHDRILAVKHHHRSVGWVLNELSGPLSPASHLLG